MSRCVLVVSLLLLVSASSAVDTAMVERFQSAGTVLWTHGSSSSESPPSRVAADGAGGASDGYLKNVAKGGSDEGSRFAMIASSSAWVGDYTSAGVVAVKISVKHLIGAAASLRFGLQSGTSQWVSSDAVVVEPGTGWHSIVFLLNANTMTRVSQDAKTFLDAFGSVNSVRIISTSTVQWRGDSTVLEMGFDNMQPSTSAALSYSLVAIRKWDQCSACAHTGSSCTGSNYALYATGRCYGTRSGGSERYEFEVDVDKVRRHIFNNDDCTSSGGSSLHRLATCYVTSESQRFEQFYVFGAHCQSEEDDAAGFGDRLPRITLHDDTGCSGNTTQLSAPAQSCLPPVLTDASAERLRCIGSTLEAVSYNDDLCETSTDTESVPSCSNEDIDGRASFSYDCSEDVFCKVVDEVPWASSAGRLELPAIGGFLVAVGLLLQVY